MNQLHVQLHLQRHHGNSMAPGGRKLPDILKSNGFIFYFFKPTFILDVTFSLLGRTTTTLEMFGCVRHREGKFQAHAASGGREREQSRERTEQGESYAVISMVCSAMCPGMVAPSGSVVVVLRLRAPSAEPTLEAE